MRYTEICRLIESAVGNVGYVHSVFRGSPYDNWNNTEVEYVSVCYDLQGVDIASDSINTYHVVINAADRLTESADNETYALDAAEAAIGVIMAALRANDAVLEVSGETLTPFVQHDGFADNLAGYYTILDIQVRNDINNC